MNGGAEAGRVESYDDVATGRVSIAIKQTLRERLGRWIAGKPQMYKVNMLPSNLDLNEAVKERAIEHTIDGGVRFRIIPAVNGKVIAYTPPNSGADPNGSALARSTIKGGEQFHVVKEDEDLLGAIAVCLALDRIKQPS